MYSAIIVELMSLEQKAGYKLRVNSVIAVGRTTLQLIHK